MPRLRTLDPGASPLHFFGAEVRHARSAAGLSQAELGTAAHCDGSVVSRIEAGMAEPPAGFPEACDTAFPERGGFFTRFWRDHQGWGGPYPPWFLDWLGIEREAAVLRMWEPMLIPGLLQAEGYARAIFSSWRQDSPGTVEAKVAARLDRQQIFARQDPPVLWVLIDEPRAASLELITEAMTRWTAQASTPGAPPATPAQTAVTALRSVTPAT